MFGQDAYFASQPIADAPRGGVDTGFDGTRAPTATAAPNGPPGTGGIDPQTFAGKGPLLEADDATVFATIHNLVLRQERLKRNQLAIDTHWTRIRQGYSWSRLEKVQDQDIWRAALPPGSERMETAAVPNKAATLCGQIVETLMVDPPKPRPHAIDFGETAERAAEMAETFLTIDGSELGTNDNAVFWNALDAAMVRASSYIHVWVDKTGGGYVPLQIKAHPQAQSPQQPEVAIDPATGLQLPAVDPVLRYVATGPDGQPTQFVTDPAQAGKQWLPRMRCDVLGREHVRIYPETAPIHDAEMIVGLWYCTLGEAKRRWPDTVATLPPEQLGELCDWTPNRYLVLLPPALRARWKLSTGDAKDTPGGSNDERMMFFYFVYRRATPAQIGQYQGYPEGASLVVSGAFGGFVIDRDTLTAEVTLPEGGTDLRCMEMPLIAVTPRMDPDDRDPSGFATISLFGGASQAAATLVTNYLEALDIILHPAKFIPATSPIQGWQIEQSRGTGDPAIVLSKDDYPHYEDPRPLPPGLIDTVQWHYNQMDAASGITKPASGANDQQEVSGIARNIAVRQALVALSRASQATLASWQRYWRVKLERAVKYYAAPQLIHYVGEDGAYKEDWFRGNDFAVIDRVTVLDGTGSMMAPAEKQQYIAFGQQMKWVSADEAAEAARPTFADALGLSDSPHQQRIERQVGAWLKGPPQSPPGAPTWVQLWDQYAQQKQAYDQAMAQYQQAAQQYQSAEVSAAIAAGGPPPEKLGPEQQNAQAMEAYQKSLIDTRINPLPAMPPQAPQMPPPTPPWHPFRDQRANDNEPEIATLRKRRLSKLMSTARFTAQPPQWQQPAATEYMAMRQASAVGFPTMAAQQQMQNGGGPSGAAGGATTPQPGASMQAMSPGPGSPNQPTGAQQRSPGRPSTA